MDLATFVAEHTERGECKCGKCIDAREGPDPASHTTDMVFFTVAKVGEPTAEDFRKLTHEYQGEFGACDPFDGKEHNYMELGAWIGDQGLAMQFMALGTMLGAFRLLSPYTVLRLPKGDSLAMQAAGMGLLSVVAANGSPPLPPEESHG